MGSLHTTELPLDKDHRPIQALALPVGSTDVQVITVSSTHAETNAFTRDGVIRVAASTDIHILRDTSPVATTSHSFMPKGVEYFNVKSGDKLSFVVTTGASNGIVSVTLMV